MSNLNQQSIKSKNALLSNDILRDMIRSQLERELRRLEDDLAIQIMSEDTCLVTEEASFLKSV